MRQIDADALTEEIYGVDWYHINKQGELVQGARSDGEALYKAGDIYKVIKDAPTIDAVSVVRCRECKWYGGDGWESDESKRRHWCNRVSEWGKCIHVNADDYCSYGERKGSE